MSTVAAFLRGVWNFIVGDDWRTALGVVLALGVTALLAQAGSSAWWVMPVAVLGLLALSIKRAARGERAEAPCTHRGTRNTRSDS